MKTSDTDSSNSLNTVQQGSHHHLGNESKTFLIAEISSSFMGISTNELVENENEPFSFHDQRKKIPLSFSTISSKNLSSILANLDGLSPSTSPLRKQSNALQVIQISPEQCSELAIRAVSTQNLNFTEGNLSSLSSKSNST
ncbi:hypothetical protein [Achromobacter sp. AGC39]